MDNNLPVVNEPEAQVANYNQVAQAQPVAKQYIEYCSIKQDADRADRLKVFNAMKQCSGLIKDALGQVVEVKDIYFKTFYSGKDQKDKCRVILFLTDGRTLVSGSFSLLSQLTELMKIFGEPNQWDKPLKIKLTTVKRDKGVAYSFEIVE